MVHFTDDPFTGKEMTHFTGFRDGPFHRVKREFISHHRVRDGSLQNSSFYIEMAVNSANLQLT